MPLYSPIAPIHVTQKSLYDATGRQVVLAGAQMRGLEVFTPTDASRAMVDAMASLTFRILRQRWNMNTVRLPVSPWIWRRDGQAYLDKVAEIVRRATAENLWVILVATDDARAGSPFETALPGPEIAEFWSTWADFFKNDLAVVFDLYSKPSVRFVPGSNPTTRRASDWQFWRNGGTATDGRSIVGMQQLADRIRATGATQLIAAPAFNDSLDFRGFDKSFFLNDPSVLYEVYPYFDHALTDAQRNTNFGFLAATVPVYAGEWGTPLQEDSPSCRSVPRNPPDATNAVIGMVTYMATLTISWTAASFEPDVMIQNLDDEAPTQFDRVWTCGQVQSPQPGMGGTLILWLTGDLYGFGTLAPELVANAAANRVGAVAPGEVVSIYGQGIGPDQDSPGVITEDGRLAASVSDTRILFDGVPAPLFYASAFQVNAQVPFEVAGRSSTVVQGFYRDVPSNKVTLRVEESAPSLFTTNGFLDLLAVNQDGFRNSSTNPAAPGSIVTMYASGTGQTSPPSVTGRLAVPPYALPVGGVSLRIGGVEAEVLYAGDAPGLVGITQINVRVPETVGQENSTVAATVAITAGNRTASGFRLWVRR